MTYETFAANYLYTSTAERMFQVAIQDIQEELDDFERFIRYVSDWLAEHGTSIDS